MTDCLGCVRCETDDMVTLISGQRVCSYCPAWRAECEARTVLAMPGQHRRRAYLFGVTEGGRVIERGVAQVRGQAAADELAALVKAVWEHQKGKA